ncbi:DNA/RNA non-specific endonuclease [Nocardioides ultimimeridianus]
MGLLLSLGGDSMQNQERKINDDEYEKRCFGGAIAGASIHYFPLDDQGRATGAMACLQGGIPRDLRDPRAPATPVGYETGMHRGHLVARMLGGISDVQNIVPLWPSANYAMRDQAELPVELATRTQTVFFTAVPVYGDALAPIGVRLHWAGTLGAAGDLYIQNQRPN